MAYHCTVTEVIRRPTGATIRYQLTSDATTPPTVVEADGAIGLDFVRPDATVPGSDPPRPYTAAERRQALRDALQAAFTSIIQRATAGDADFQAVQTALAGFTFP